MTEPGTTSMLLGLIAHFAFLYPLVMTCVWIVGALMFYWRWERHETPGGRPALPEDAYPPASLVVPCHNEADHLRETILSLARQDYPDFEIIAVNDASTDDTGNLLDILAAQISRLRVIHMTENRGKAAALNTAALASRHEFLLCMDGDAVLDPGATRWMMRHFVGGPRVGAVTGNPRIRTRSTVLGRLQVGEFSAIIGMIKRAQRIYGNVFTVSGVLAAFRKTALMRSGFWSANTVTDDIDISWKMQLDHWAIRYEPNALCWILMPERLRGIWRQRLRWARGGVEALMRHGPKLLRWRRRRFWGVALELVLSITWAYSMAITLLLWGLAATGLLSGLPEGISPLPRWEGVVLGVLCLLLFAVGMSLDSRHEPGLWRNYFWIIWYPVAFWLLTMATTVVALPLALLHRDSENRGVWTSPDRGLGKGPKQGAGRRRD